MNIDLSGKRALVCGASSGIGRACAVELASLGASVTLVARDAARLQAAVSDLSVGHRQSHAWLAMDTSDPAGVAARMSDHLAQQASGAAPYHILINNTGGPPGGAMADATAAQLTAAFNSLLVSAHLITQSLLPGMKQAGYGRIINISSTSVKQPIPGLGLSNAVRAAVSNWGKTLSQEVGKFGITVNSVLPGYTDTDRLAELFRGRSAKSGQSVDSIRSEAVGMIPAGRLGRAEEIAAAVAFLASPAASYVNGVQLPVDGGRLGCL
jgi:3-oxoacyl-[acyl-carrier protein] reductase